MDKGERTRERIVEHAVAVASREGLEGLTIGGLAGDLDLSKSGLYAHFGSKEELQVQVLEAGIARFREQVVEPVRRTAPGQARVRELFHRWLAWDVDSGLPGGCVMTAAAIELDDRPGRPRDVLAAALREWMEFIRSVVAGAVERGELRGDLDIDQFAFDLYAIFLSFHLAHRMMRDPAAETRARTSFDRLLASARP